MALARSMKLIYSISLILILVLSTLSIPGSDANSMWHQSTSDDFRDGSFNNLTLTNKGVEVELRLRDIPLNWTEVKPKPNPNSFANVAMDTIWGTDEVLLYNSGSTWIFNLSTNKWTNKNPPTNPGTLIYFTMASIYGTDKVVIFGGAKTGFFNSLNKTWAYDRSDNNWTWINTTKTPPARSLHAMATIWGTDNAVIFGGYGTGGIRGDTWVFDLSDENWTESASPEKPSPTYYQDMASVWGDDKAVLFGGYSFGGIQNTTWVYDQSTDMWTDKKAKNTPKGRYLNTMTSVYGHNKVLMFGGYSTGGMNNELWRYDLDLNRWYQEAPAQSPSARYMHNFASFWGVEKALLFGGYVMRKGYVSDTWILNLNFKLRFQEGKYTSQGYDTGYNSAFKEFAWHTEVTENTTINFQVRTAGTEGALYPKPFLGPDGTRTTYYETSPTPLWSGHHSDIWIQYRVYFNSNSSYDTSYLKNVTITYNNLPITELSSPADGAVQTINQPTFRWWFTDYDSASQSTFQVVIDNESTFDDIDFDSGEQISSFKLWKFPDGTTHTTLPDGTWYWKVRTKDNDGDWGMYSSPRRILVDTQLPSTEIAKPTDASFLKHLQELSGSAYDVAPGSGLDRVELSLTRQSDNFTWSGKKWENAQRWFEATGTNSWSYDSSVIEWASNEQYVLKSRAVDNASNTQVQYPEVTFMIDFEWPASKIVYPITDSFVTELNAITGTATDKTGSGVETVELSIQRLDDELYWTGFGWDADQTWLGTLGTTSWSFDSTAVPWTSDKYYLLETRSTDITGNSEFEGLSVKFMFDDRPPGFSFSMNKDSPMANNPKASLAITASDQGSGVDVMAISADGTFWSNWEPFANELSYDLPGSDGTKNVYIKLRDTAGNTAEPISKSIILDTTPPENVTVIINGDAEHTNSLTVNLALTADDKLSGIDKISLGYDGVSWSDWEPFRTSLQFPMEAKNGRKKIWFRVSDIAGNIAKALDDIILDTEPPDPVIIFINRNDETTDSTDVKLTLHAEDLITGTSLMAFSTDGTNWTEWEKYIKTNSKPYGISTGDGTKTVYFKVKDRAGNIADAVSDSIILDTSIPEIEKQEEQAIITDVESNSFIFILIIIAIIIASILIAAMSYTRRKRRIKAEREAVEKPAASGQIAKPVGSALPAPAGPQVPQLPAATAPGAPQQASQLALPPGLQPAGAAQTTAGIPGPIAEQPPPEWGAIFSPEIPDADKKDVYPCTQCGEPLEKVSEGRFYCYTCQKYE